MITDDYSLPEVLQYLPCSECSYMEWVEVGQALKLEGYSIDIWEDWSATDTGRYHAGECAKKWKSFNQTGITAGTVIQMALDKGWKPEQKQDITVYDWDSEISLDAGKKKPVIDQHWIESVDVPQPPDPWLPGEQVKRYLEIFAPTEYVGLSMESFEDSDGNLKPTKGVYDKTAGDIIKRIDKYNGDLGYAIADYNPQAGAWVHFNPLDGKGVSDSNVTSYRYALVESDSMPIAKQYALLLQLKLPIRIIVHSGKKSLHAIVKIDANTYQEYRQRVDRMYKVLGDNGFKTDIQNRNPSRLSRLPGIERNGKKQYIVAENVGLSSFQEWDNYIHDIEDDLPEIESFTSLENLPALAPELITGVLRTGHKMLISGPSKAGKSFLLTELAIAIAEGGEWLGHKCMQGRVLYINLEVDGNSFKQRLKEIYCSMDQVPSGNIDIWNLRGAACPMDKLTPKILRKASEKGYTAIILDPLYKVLTGDENSAEQMSKFCNYFDAIAKKLQCAMIYCHHHSKGAQGAKKSQDRASGSGVFARDPDAQLDMIQLVISDSQLDEMIRQRKHRIITRYLNTYLPGWETSVDKTNYLLMLTHAKTHLTSDVCTNLDAELFDLEQGLKTSTAWRIEYTLREFKPHDNTLLWFSYPLHHVDTSQVLAKLKADGEKKTYAEKKKAQQEKKEEQQKEQQERYDNAYQNANFGDPPTVQQMADFMGVTRTTVSRQLEKFGYYYDKNVGHVIKEEEQEE